jgi:hypothetical protein
MKRRITSNHKSLALFCPSLALSHHHRRRHFLRLLNYKSNEIHFNDNFHENYARQRGKVFHEKFISHFIFGARPPKKVSFSSSLISLSVQRCCCCRCL